MDKEYFIIEKENVNKLDRLVDEFGLNIKSICNNANSEKSEVEGYFIDSCNLDDVMSKVIDCLNDVLVDNELNEMLKLVGVSIDIFYQCDNTQWAWHNINEIL